MTAGDSSATDCSPTVNSSINGKFEGWDGDTIFQLVNGQMWEQDEYDYMYSYSYSPAVQIYSDYGTCKMAVARIQDHIAVKRVNTSAGVSSCVPAVNSNIDGEFEGWDGDTIFRLMNGQIWQQSEYSYTYSYSYMPSVTIYSGSGGCILEVDGLNDSIRVTQIN